MQDWADHARLIQGWVKKQIRKALKDRGINERTIDADVLRGVIDSSVVLPPHAASHEDGGADEMDLGSIAGTITDTQHGERGGGALHVNASGAAAGFMSVAHFTRVNSVSAFIDTLLDDADAATARATLGLGAGGAGDIWVLRAGDTMTGNLIISRALTAALSLISTGSAANLTVQSDAGNANFQFSSAQNSQSQLNFNTLDTGVAESRWIILKNSDSESGSNAGANLEIRRRDDSGNALGTLLFGVRSNGRVGINRASAASVTHQLDVSGDFRAVLADAATNAISEVVRIGHNSTGTPAAGYGSRMLWQLASSTTADQDAAAIDAVWSTATNASRTAYLSVKVVQAAAALAEVARFDKSATATHTGLHLWDADNGTLERVTVGAADSGGTGFKVLRIPN